MDKSVIDLSILNFDEDFLKQLRSHFIKWVVCDTLAFTRFDYLDHGIGLSANFGFPLLIIFYNYVD